MRRPAVYFLALLGAVLAAGVGLAFWVIWGAHRAPRSHLVDICALAVSGLLLAALARSPRSRRPGREAISPSALSVPIRVWAPWLAPAMWALCGGLLGAAAMGSLAIAPWLLLASLCFAVAGFLASRGVRFRAVRGISMALVAALLNAAVLWVLLLSGYAHESPEAFRSRGYYANELLADVPVHDIWVLHLTGGGEGRTVQDVQAVMSTLSPWEANFTVVVLVAIRGLLGSSFGWDEEIFDEPELSYLQRVSDEVRARSLQEPGVKGGYFRLMYTLDNETVAEILNRTAHAFFCMAMEPTEDGYTLYWVIFVKEEQPLTPFYMALIDPFRRYLVHPMILRSLQQHWRHRYTTQTVLQRGLIADHHVNQKRLLDVYLERVRCSQGPGMPMGTFLNDIRYAFRTLTASPGFLAVAVLTLAIGIGANTAIFSVVNGVLLRPLPYPEPDRLYRVYQTHDEWVDSEVAILRAFAMHMPTSYPRGRAWAHDNPVFSYMASFDEHGFALTSPDRSERIEGTTFAGDLFGVLGVQPFLGRGFLPEEDEIGADLVVVLSYGAWQTRFGGTTEVIGQTMILDGDTYTIIGVMPQDFYFPDRSNELWAFLGDEDRDDEWGSQWLATIGRLKPGVLVEEAQSGMEILQAGINEIDPEADPDEEPYGIRLVSHLEDVVGDTRPTLIMLLAAVGLVLLVACANIANLLLVRATGRRREVAVRAALGAGRARIIRQLLAESVLLALAGGTFGLTVAYWSLGPLRLMIPEGMPRIDDIGLDPSVLGFTLLVSGFVGVLFGLVPSLQASRLSLATVLQESSSGSVGGSRRSRSRAFLVVAEVAVTVVLLVGAALLVNSYWRLQSEERGFDAQNLLTLRIYPLAEGFPEQQDVIRFQRELLERTSALPGVLSATMASTVPFSGSTSVNTFTMVDGELPEGAEGRSLRQIVEPGYFRTMGIPLLRGRVFTAQDDAGGLPVIVVNSKMAAHFWPGQDPIGKQIRTGSHDDEEDGEVHTVIGVVGDIKHRRLGEEIEAKRYRPLGQEPIRYTSLAIRTAGDPLDLAPLVRSTLWDIDNRVTIRNLSSMQELVSDSASEPRFRTLLLSLLAGIAVTLSMIGVYAVIAYSVAQGTREIGVRMALGADPSRVLRQVMVHGLRLAVLGVIIGLGVALAATRVLESYLYEVSTTDPITFSAVALIVVVFATLSTLIPARRATRIDPMVALRSD